MIIIIIIIPTKRLTGLSWGSAGPSKASRCWRTAAVARGSGPNCAQFGAGNAAEAPPPVPNCGEARTGSTMLEPLRQGAGRLAEQKGSRVAQVYSLVEIRISYKVIMGVRSCAARLAIFPPVTGGGSLHLSTTSPVMGISSRADRVYQQS
jgi:hypothetical protein